MRVIQVDKITGFRTVNGVKVFQFGKPLPFYIREIASDFNLPIGKYSIHGDFVQLSQPVKRKLPVLPKPERNLKVPRVIEVEYGENPNKATINLMRGKILLDNSFLSFPAYVRTFIFFHEIGHYFYSQEKYCDLFAAKKMLEKGYNPSQITTAQNLTLSHFGGERKCFIHDHMKKAKR